MTTESSGVVASTPFSNRDFALIAKHAPSSWFAGVFTAFGDAHSQA